jgi:hypothetical protein
MPHWNHQVRSVAFSPDGKILASDGFDQLNWSTPAPTTLPHAGA